MNKKIVIVLAFCYSDISMLNLILASIKSELYEGQLSDQKKRVIPIKSCKQLFLQNRGDVFQNGPDELELTMTKTMNINAVTFGQRELLENICVKHITKIQELLLKAKDFSRADIPDKHTKPRFFVMLTHDFVKQHLQSEFQHLDNGAKYLYFVAADEIQCNLSATSFWKLRIASKSLSMDQLHLK